jgi:glutamate dehydrogenase (NADP+)
MADHFRWTAAHRSKQEEAIPMTQSCDDFLTWARERHPGQAEYLQAIGEFAHSVWPLVSASDRYRDGRVMERLAEPDRIVSFRVCWEDDNAAIQVNRGYRVQYSNALGPYKGGLRFHPRVNASVLQFLGLEQTLKNALTGLPMGGGKGGADFDPSGRSDREIMRFCYAYMSELHRHIAPDLDIPAGDIGVGVREIGYLFGAYKRITGVFSPVLTGKQLAFGGSAMRIEATGYGLVYFVCRMLGETGEGFDGKQVVISGAGNVATHAAEKAIELGGQVIALSDSNGFIHDKAGIDAEKLAWVRRHKARPGTSLEAYTDEFAAAWHCGERPWALPCDIALPCATENELDGDAARTLIDNGCAAVGEGANMPCTAEAVAALREAEILFAPGKAANAGGVALSGLEISQNMIREPRSRDDLAQQLNAIMCGIHDRCVETGRKPDGRIDYLDGANIAGFNKVAEAMLAFGID